MNFSDLLAILAILITISIYILTRRVKAPKVGIVVLHQQAGYEMRYFDTIEKVVGTAVGFPTTSNKIFRPPSDPSGTGSQAPFLHFDIANPSQFEVHLKDVQIQVTSFRKETLYVGNGEMISGSRSVYTTKLEGRVGLYKSRMTDTTAEWDVINPGETISLAIRMESKDEGLYVVCPVIRWSALLKSGEVRAKNETTFIFFEGDPLTYRRPVVSADLE